MFSNTELPANLGMRKLTKSEHYGVTRRLRQKNYELQNIFHTQPGRQRESQALLSNIFKVIFLPSAVFFFIT